MFRFHIALFLAACAVLVGHQEASAQRRVPGYRGGNTISPYTQLFAPNNGGLNQYFSFVRPAQQLRQFEQEGQQQLYQLDQAVQMQNRLLLGPQLNPGYNQTGAMSLSPGSQLQFRPSSRAGIGQLTPHASYFNYGSFYNYPIQPMMAGRSGRVR